MDFLSPHSDAHPPRHAIESDDEEDYDAEGNTRSQNASQPHENVKVTFVGTLPQGKALIIASNDIGKRWAAGAELGEQVGGVYVSMDGEEKGHQIGLVFTPAWAAGNANAIVSEATALLPVSAMHAYAEKVIGEFKPSSLIILDTYSVASYISTAKIPYDNAPVRYLCYSGGGGKHVESLLSTTNLEPYSPPNMIQSTSASFISIIASAAGSVDVAAFLLPSSRISRASRALTIEVSTTWMLDADGGEEWSDNLISDVHRTAVRLAGVDFDGFVGWKRRGGSKSVSSNAASRRGDDGMYI